jgi:hypothetical protein
MANVEQYEELPPVWSWVVLILFAGAVFTWMMSLHMMICDVPRQWDFGELPIAPGESLYTTAAPPAGNLNGPPQMEPLPEAQPPAGGLRP